MNSPRLVSFFTPTTSVSNTYFSGFSENERLSLIAQAIPSIKLPAALLEPLDSIETNDGTVETNQDSTAKEDSIGLECDVRSCGPVCNRSHVTGPTCEFDRSLFEAHNLSSDISGEFLSYVIVRSTVRPHSKVTVKPRQSSRMASRDLIFAVPSWSLEANRRF